MVTRKKPAELLPYDGEEITDVFETVPQKQGETAQQKRLEDILNDLQDTGDDSEIRVFRQNPMGGKAPMIYLCAFPVDKFSLSELYEYLRKNYGGGEYRIHVRVNGRLMANKLVQIEAEKNTPEKTGTDTAEILKAVMDRQEKMMNVLLHREAGGGNSRREFFEELLLMKQFFDRPAPAVQTNAISQLSETVLLLKELGLNIGGGSDSEPGFGTLLEKMAPVIQTALTQKQAPQPIAQEYKPNPTEPLSAKAQPQPQPNRGNDMFIKMGINTLLKGAEKGTDPAVYADMVFDQLPAATIQQFLTAPDSFAKLVEVNPRVLEFKDWFEDVGEHCKAHLGLPSKFADLYDDPEDAINGEAVTEEESEDENNNADELHPA